MKRQKKAFALLAAILMMASLLSIGTLAESDKDSKNETRYSSNKDYIAAINCYMRGTSTGGGTATYVAKGKRVYGTATSNSSWSPNATFVSVTYNSVSGYMQNKTIVPIRISCRVNKISTYLYNSASDTSGYVIASPLSKGTIVADRGVSGMFRHVYAFVGNQVYSGYVLVANVEYYSGTD